MFWAKILKKIKGVRPDFSGGLLQKANGRKKGWGKNRREGNWRGAVWCHLGVESSMVVVQLKICQTYILAEKNAAVKMRNVCVYYAGSVIVGTMMRQFVQVGSEREV